MVFRFLLPAVVVGLAAAAEVHVVEEIIAKINGDIVTRGEMERQRLALEADLRQKGLSGANLTQAVREQERDVLRNQVDTLLLVQKAKDLNISVDPEVTRRLAEIQTGLKITDPDKFQQYIRENLGMTFEDFKQQMKNQFLTQRVIGQEVQRSIVIPEPEKRKYYEEHKTEFVRQEEVYMRQILISTEGKTAEQVATADKKAKDLVARARKGEKFGELARDNSDDPETAKNQGELPPYKRGMLLKQIEDVVFTQKKGYVTDPIKVTNGFLILKVEERYEAGQAPYEEVENEVSERLAVPQMEPKVRAYLTKLRQDAFLEIREGWVDSGAAPGKDTAWKDVAQLKPETTTKEEVAARKRKKFLGIIPHGRVGPVAPAATPGTAPASTAPASTAPASTPAQPPAQAPAIPPSPPK
jgi:peptidyl-prolyl cis-trans isomerase SurA